MPEDSKWGHLDTAPARRGQSDQPRSDPKSNSPRPPPPVAPCPPNRCHIVFPMQSRADLAWFLPTWTTNGNSGEGRRKRPGYAGNPTDGGGVEMMSTPQLVDATPVEVERVVPVLAFEFGGKSRVMSTSDAAKAEARTCRNAPCHGRRQLQSRTPICPRRVVKREWRIADGVGRMLC